MPNLRSSKRDIINAKGVVNFCLETRDLGFLGE